MALDTDRVRAALPAYEMGGELGRGGWGVVLAGRHRQLGRNVAIKQLPRAFGADPGVRARFVAEARLLASLDHPHIVPVFDYVESGGLCLLVMEMLPGGSLWDRFTTVGVSPEAACALVLATCAGLRAAHQRGILHRDVKPENLLFSESGVVKITDFGIAKVVGGDATMATRAGEVLGTPAYMSPEQAKGSILTPATDVYATGVMLYELLSGHLPFPDDSNPIVVLHRHVFEQPKPLTDVAPSIPPPIAAVAMRAIATAPEDRYPTAEAFGVALAEATTAAWGTGWPKARGMMEILGAGPILGPTERVFATPNRGTRATPETLLVPPTVAPPSLRGPLTPPHGVSPLAPPHGVSPLAPPPGVSPAPATVAASPPPAAPTAVPPPPAAPPTLIRQMAPAPPAPMPSVRPSVRVHSHLVAADDMSFVELVPVDFVLDRPPLRAPGLVARALAVVRRRPRAR